MTPLHPALSLPKLSAASVDASCHLMAEGFCEYCPISSGGRTLFWDGMVAIIQHYKKLGFSDAIEVAQEYVAFIDPGCNVYDTSMAYGNWYYVFRDMVHRECNGRYDKVVDIGLRAMKYPMWKLYLDDVENPPDKSYVLARSVAEAQALILEHGVPLFISFDCDLGVDERGVLLPSGEELARWIVERDMDKKSTIHIFSVFDFEVHSKNPSGKNIKSYLDAYLKHKEKEGNWYGY